MLECQRQLGMERGKRMMEMVERVTGRPCPCLHGGQCILIPTPRARDLAGDEDGDILGVVVNL